jgi:hypothetical protein
MEIARCEGKELAITQGYDIGIAALGNQQRKLSEKISTAELNGARLDPHFHSARRDELHRVASLAFTDDYLVWHGEARLQHTSDGASGLPVQSHKHRDPADQILAL